MNHIAPISSRPAFSAAAAGVPSAARSLSLLERVKKAVQAIFASIAYWITLPFQKQMKSGEFLDTLDAIIADKKDLCVVIREGAVSADGLNTLSVKENFKKFLSDDQKRFFLCPVIVRGTLFGNHIVTIVGSKQNGYQFPFLWFFDSKGRSINDKCLTVRGHMHCSPEDERNLAAKTIWDSLVPEACNWDSPVPEDRKRSLVTGANRTAFQGFFDGHSCGPHVLRVYELLIEGKHPSEISRILSRENIEETRKGQQELLSNFRKNESAADDSDMSSYDLPSDDDVVEFDPRRARAPSSPPLNDGDNSPLGKGLGSDAD
jgi:hypothetical protein